ncbi:MAG: metallophosphoesterase [Clostridia bacterium]|nr:metallophosphoesterase [Clostridia bacterium]
MKTRFVRLSGKRFGKNLRFALVSDLHGEDPREALEILRREHPDYILMPGDILERLDGVEDAIHQNGFSMLSEAAKIAPVFYSTGNHEDGGVHSWCIFWKIKTKPRIYHEQDLSRIEESGACFLRDGFTVRDGIAFGGLQSGLINEGGSPNLEWLGEFCAQKEPKVLLCHHPEYYERYLKELPIDLIVSGHAHGGQWRFFGRGVFAPGQGLFPKYTDGVHDDRLVIGTGLKKGSILIPRLFNAPEVVIIDA